MGPGSRGVVKFGAPVCELGGVRGGQGTQQTVLGQALRPGEAVGSLVCGQLWPVMWPEDPEVSPALHWALLLSCRPGRVPRPLRLDALRIQ